MPTPAEVLELGPRACARLVRETLLAAEPAGEAASVADQLLADAQAAGASDAWREAARHVWAHEALRNECDRVPALRTRLRQAAVGGVLEAVGDLLAQRCATRQGEANLIAVVEGRLWIADLLLRELVYHLELDERGIGPGFADEAVVADLVAQPEGAPGLWRRWLRWAGDGAAPARAFVAHPHVVGSLPACGVAASSPRLRALVCAARRTPPSGGPLLVVGDQPVLVPWLAAALPDVVALAAGSRADDERDLLREPATLAGLRRAAQRDGTLALTALLTRTGEPTVGAALEALIVRTALAVVALGSEHDGVLQVDLPTQPRLPTLRLARADDRLALEADALAALVTWLGLFPYRYDAGGGAATWPWRCLAACGWQALALARRWRFAGDGSATWIVLTAPVEVRSLRALSLVPASPIAASCVEMTVDACWQPTSA